MTRPGRVILNRLRAQARVAGWPATLRFASRLLLVKIRELGWRRALVQWRGLGRRADSEATYARWIAVHLEEGRRLAHRAEDARQGPGPLVSVITPVYNTPPHWLRACAASLRRQTYAHWQWCVADDASTDPATIAVLNEFANDPQGSTDPRISVVRLSENAGISVASNAALAAARGDIIVLLDHDDELADDALTAVVEYLAAHPTVDVVYSDEDKLELDGRHSEPYFKPDWSPDHFMGTMYTCHLTAARRSIVDAAGGFRAGYEGAQDYDLWLRMMEQAAARGGIGHVPRILYHWRKIPGSTATESHAKPWALDAGAKALADAVRRRGRSAEVVPGLLPGNYRIRELVVPATTVSIVIATRGARSADRAAAARAATCLRTIVETTRGLRCDLIFVTEDGTLPVVVGDVVAGVAHQVIGDTDTTFNFSRRVNRGAAAAAGEYLLLLNDDVEAIGPGWLEALVEYASQPEIGAVGPRLDYPDGRIQHVGLVLGVCGLAAHAFHQAPETSAGYFGSAMGPRNYSAITGACLLTRRVLFADVGGLDAALPVDFNDVDYCLQLQARGYRVVYTPFARLRHHESASTGRRTADASAAAYVRGRWADVIAHDPYWNPHLSRDFADYRLP